MSGFAGRPGRSRAWNVSWDMNLAQRAGAVGLLVSLVALLVVAATDGGASWRARMGMTSALMPIAGALGTLLAVRTAESRGELLALAGLGVAPSRTVLGAILGGALVGILGAALSASPLVDLALLFPRATTAVWVVDELGAHELTHGLRVLADGALRFDAEPVAPALPYLPITGVTACVIAVTALAAPSWVAVPSMSTARRAATGGLLLVLGIVSFQVVAADRAPAFALVIVPFALLADAVRAHAFS